MECAVPNHIDIMTELSALDFGVIEETDEYILMSDGQRQVTIPVLNVTEEKLERLRRELTAVVGELEPNVADDNLTCIKNWLSS
jgi:hypothetical protein